MIPSVADEKLKKHEKEVIRTVLGCLSCNAEVLREFADGDFIFKEDDKPCEKCGGSLVVRQIYSEIISSKKAKPEKATGKKAKA